MTDSTKGCNTLDTNCC